MRDTGNEVSQENIELVRRLYAELASEGSPQEFEKRLTDDALGRFLDPGIEWAPVAHSLLAVDSYRGFDGVRRFWRLGITSAGSRASECASIRRSCRALA